ncbi:MAG: hypothetical protein JST93_25280 [Acidobacteria bacterium]|nr:hypothetical protein [Acidobacteriota bacterium]
MILPALLFLLLPPEPNDWLIVPGVRVGPIRATSTKADLRAAFGASNVTERTVHIEEGVMEPATVVYPNDPTRRLSITWRDGHPQLILICHEQRQPHCKWHTADGISLGVRMSRLQDIHASPFEVNCLYLRSWWKNTSFLIGFHTAPFHSGNPECRQIQGDRVVPSNHPCFRALNPAVIGLSVEFRP